MHKQKTKIILAALALCVLLSGCGLGTTRTYMGFDKSEFPVVAEEDSHGGFLGDGSCYLILDCASDPEKALDLVRDWKPLPLSEPLRLLMYGGEGDDARYGYELAKEAHWPNIEHGYYKFIDRQAEDPADDSGVLGRYSFNFEIAAYDTDSNRFYYFKFDT